MGEDVRGPHACLEGRDFPSSGRLPWENLGGRLQDKLEGDHFPRESEGDDGESLKTPCPDPFINR